MKHLFFVFAALISVSIISVICAAQDTESHVTTIQGVNGCNLGVVTSADIKQDVTALILPGIPPDITASAISFAVLDPKLDQDQTETASSESGKTLIQYKFVTTKCIDLSLFDSLTSQFPYKVYWNVSEILPNDNSISFSDKSLEYIEYLYRPENDEQLRAATVFSEIEEALQQTYAEELFVFTDMLCNVATPNPFNSNNNPLVLKTMLKDKNGNIAVLTLFTTLNICSYIIASDSYCARGADSQVWSWLLIDENGFRAELKMDDLLQYSQE